jgi:hypothetical protein
LSCLLFSYLFVSLSLVMCLFSFLFSHVALDWIGWTNEIGLVTNCRISPEVSSP